MKKKLLFVIVTVITCALIAIGCAKAPLYPDYDGFDGTNENNHLTVDDYFVLDGKLEEDIWTQSTNAIDIEGATYDWGKQQEVDVETYGERSATVYSYIGEKAIYFAFDVMDKNLYYNPYRSQHLDTGVEIYFCGIRQSGFDDGCWSVRVNPTGPNPTDVNIGVYRPRIFLNDEGAPTVAWKDTNVGAKVQAACQIDGEIMTSAAQFDYTTENNVGYTIEIAIDISMLNDAETGALQYTGAFVQARNFTEERINNTFIAGTSYLTPASWILVNNEGIIDDKVAFLDSFVEADEGVIFDGKFDDAIWENTVARTLETNRKRSSALGELENLTYSFRSVTTDKGVYVGIESNDAYLYYADGVGKNKNTGAEIAITANKGTVVSPKDTILYFFNVGGEGDRRRGVDVTDKPAGTWAYSDSVYYPAKTASMVGGEMNSDNSTGWSSEIFIPWDAFEGEVEYRDGVAIMFAGYRSTGEGVADYLAPYDREVFAGGAANMNPQERWFVFENGKPKYDLKINDITLDRNSLDANDNFVTEIDVKYSSKVITNASYTEKFPEVASGNFDFGTATGVEVTDEGDGKYTLAVPSTIAPSFESAKSVTFTTGTSSTNFALAIDTEFGVDGIFDEATYATLKKLYTSQTTNGVTATNEFTIALRERAMYLSSVISDENFTALRNTQGFGLELYFNFGEEVNATNTYQIRVQSHNEDTLMMQYKPGNETWPWSSSWVVSDVERVYVDNNDGTYNLEVKIPYSVFGLTEKPESINVAPFTRFYCGWVSTKIELWEGGRYTDDYDKYKRFTSEGFAPVNAVVYSEEGTVIPEINFLKNIELVGNNYVGSIALSLYPESRQMITDAQFGDLNAYFTSNGDGTYEIEIPKSAFNEGNVIAEITSEQKNLKTSIALALKDFTSVYLESTNGYPAGDEVTVYAFDAVEKSGSKYYETKFRVYSDSTKRFDITTDKIADFTVGFEGVDGVIVEKEGNAYTVLVPVTAFSETTLKAVTAKNGSATLSTNLSFSFNLMNEADINAKFTDKSLLYLNFNDNGYANTLNNGVQTYFEWGAENKAINDGVYTMNQAERALNAQGVTLGNQFTLSMMVNGNDVMKMWPSHYGNQLFGTGNVDGDYGYIQHGTGKVPFGIYVRSGVLYVEIANHWGQTGIGFNHLMTQEHIAGWKRWTFTIDRTASATSGKDTVEVKFYLDGVLKGTGSTEIDSTHKFNNPDGIVGIGAPAKYYDGEASWLTNGKPAWYIAGGGDVSSNHDLRLDNVLLYDGIMSVEDMKLVDSVDRFIKNDAPAVSQTVINNLKTNSQLYINFDNDEFANRIGTATTYFEWGATDNSRANGVYTANQAERALNASGVTLGDQFTVSMMINGDDVRKTWGGGYARTLFSTGNVDGEAGYKTGGVAPSSATEKHSNKYVGFGIYLTSTVLWVQMEDYGWDNVSIDMSDIIKQKIGGWQRWTFTVDRTKNTAENIDTVTVKLYLDGILAKTGTTTVASTHNFNNVDNIVGIGAPAKYHDIWWDGGVTNGKPLPYITSGATSADYDIRLDNIMLYNGVMSVEMMNAIDKVDTDLVANA